MEVADYASFQQEFNRPLQYHGLIFYQSHGEQKRILHRGLRLTSAADKDKAAANTIVLETVVAHLQTLYRGT